METKKIFGIGLIVVIFLFLIKVLNLYFPIYLVNTTRSSELVVTGEGKVEVVPDTAYVEVGISVNNAAKVDDAQNHINEVNNKIISAMKKLGIAKEDIKTSNYSIYPNYSYERSENKITGYNASVNISIKLKKTSLVAKVIEEATSAGANQVQGARFSVDQPEKYREEARNKAIANAKEQAYKLASTLGISLGKVSNIVESSNNSPIYYERAAKALSLADAASAPAPEIEVGTQTISSVVTLYFEKR